MTSTILRAAMAAAAISLFSFAPATAHEGHSHGSIAVTDGFARAMPPRAPSAGGYLTLTNSGSVDDNLLMVTSPAAEEVQVHETIMENDMMQMGPINGELAVPAGQSVTLEPGGVHLMFLGVNEPFAKGDEVEIVLHFEHAGMVEATLPVAPIGANEAPMDHPHH